MRKTFYDFVNKEMSFTFGSSVAVRVIHEEIQEIHRHRFRSIHKFFFPSQFNTSQTITRGASTWSIVLEWCMFYETCVSAKTCNEHFHLSGILQLHVVMCFQAKGFTVG